MRISDALKTLLFLSRPYKKPPFPQLHIVKGKKACKFLSCRMKRDAEYKPQATAFRPVSNSPSDRHFTLVFLLFSAFAVWQMTLRVLVYHKKRAYSIDKKNFFIFSRHKSLCLTAFMLATVYTVHKYLSVKRFCEGKTKGLLRFQKSNPW